MRRALAVAPILCLLPLLAASEPQRTAPQTIDAFHALLLDVMQHAVELGYEGRERKLAPAIPEFFDVGFMARTSVGRYWNEASEEDKRRYLDAFGRFMVANYAGQFDGYSGQRFETLGEEPARQDTVVVRSRLIDALGEPVVLNYRMRQAGDGWKIVDVYLDGTVSELALRRSEFSSIVKRDKFDGLIRAIDAKIAALEAGSGTS